MRLLRHQDPPSQSRRLALGGRALRPLSADLLACLPGERAGPAQGRWKVAARLVSSELRAEPRDGAAAD